MPYLNIDIDFLGHPKTQALVAALGDGSEIYLLRLWSYAAKYHFRDGLLTYTSTRIEGICGYVGEAGKLVDLLCEIRWLKRSKKGYSIHDWTAHQGHISFLKDRAKKAANSRWKCEVKTRKNTQPIKTKEVVSDATTPPVAMLVAMPNSIPFHSIPFHSIPPKPPDGATAENSGAEIPGDDPLQKPGAATLSEPAPGPEENLPIAERVPTWIFSGIPDALAGRDFLDAWAEWFSYCDQAGRTPAALTVRKQLVSLAALGKVRAIAAISYSIQQGFKGIYEPKSAANFESRDEERQRRNRENTKAALDAVYGTEEK